MRDTLQVLIDYRDAFLSGATITLFVTTISALIGLLIGAAVFLLRIGFRRDPSRTFARFMAVASPLFQAVPIMVLLVWVHYALPALLGIRFDSLTTSIVVLSVVSILSSISIILSSYLKIPRDEIEAAEVLGIERTTMWRRILFPMIWRDSLPLLIGHWIDLAKLSTLCSAIALPELLNTTSGIVSNTYQALPAYTALGLVFIAILLPLNVLQQRLETALPVKR